ncbi:MAG: DUF2076 domain-containing protein [Verrucomicrobia bacterium]|nr:DUF2076 domain-containing protein [Verrucomicrobiota bacterium]
MTPEERNLISSLFDRLRKADTAPKDSEAEEFIRQKVAEAPAAPYLLVQSVLVLEHAVANAQARIADLEKQLAAANQNQKASHGGGFLSGLFGGGRHEEQAPPPASPQNQPAASRPAYAPPPPQPLYAPPPPTPYPSTTNLQPGAGGSFLRGALSTAAGVAGGALLAQGIENLIGHHAGPFGSAIGGDQGGFLPEDVQNTEVTNNYYVNENPQDVQNAQDFDSGDQGGVADQNVDYDPGQDDNLDSVDDTFDDGGGSGDDTSFV